MHVEYPPSLSISALVKKLKGRSSRLLQQEFPALGKKYWGRHFWAVGYGVWSTGKITDEINLLVQPPENYYWNKFINIHGITPKDTLNAPTFDKIQHKIELFIKNQIVVAHNGLSFDFPVLNKTLEYYGMQTPDYEKHYVLTLQKRK